MPKFQLIFLLIFSCFLLVFNGPCFAQKNSKKKLSSKATHSQQTKIKLHPVWSINTDPNKHLLPSIIHNSQPLLTEDLVIQANAWNGIQAFTKNKGKLVWSFYIKNGSFSPLEAHKQKIYFGASDGFFYSLDIKTGKLIWKFFTGSENLSRGLVDKGLIYWMANNQKLYAVSLKGKLAWIYAGPSLVRDMVLRAGQSPAIYKNFIYIGFYDGSLFALDKKTGQFKWKKTLSSSQAISGDLFVSSGCLFVSVFKSYTYCLNPWNGHLRWKKTGDDILFPKGDLFYQISESKIQAYKKTKLRKIWKKSVKNYPVLPTIYKKYLIYGSSLDGNLYIVDKKTGFSFASHYFGRGLAAPVTVDNKTGDIYFFSVNSYLHKIQLL